MGGYDAALDDAADDLLERRHVARRLHRLLTGTPADWSVRVGLLGDWGEGKSTVAGWTKALVEGDGHLVAWFAPTASATAEDLWAGLASAVLKAADARKIEPQATTRLRAFVTGRDAARRLAEAAKASKATQAIQSAATKFLEIGPGHLKEVRAALGPDRRVVVILDDLDRADPRLLPGLLLALRDVLDLPGYSFLLPFDEDVVAASLQEYNKAWGDGRRFLDKILDFRVRLPAIGLAERRRLFEAETARACPFVPHGAAAGLEEVLPPNPRQLKALARGLSLMEEEARRHRQDELDWRSAICASLLREVDEAFFHAYVEDTFNAFGSDGITRRNRQLERLMDKEKGEQKERERVSGLLDRYAIPRVGMSTDNILQLCGVWLQDVGISDSGRVYRTVRLLTEASEGATWADHDNVLQLFREGTSAEGIAEWVGQQATQRGVTARGLAVTLILALCTGYSSALGIAADTMLASEHAKLLAEAGTSLALLGTLADDGLPSLPPEDVRAIAFPALLSAASQWERYARNTADAEARARELTLLSKWADSAGAQQRVYIEAVESAEGILQRVTGGESRLRATLRTRLAPDGTEALARLEQRGGVEELLRMDGSDLDRTALLDPNGPLWRASAVRGAAAVLVEAPSRPAVQENARRLLDLLWFALRGDIALRATAVPEAFLTSGALGLVWDAATATPLQFRMLEDLRKLRDTFVERGAEEALLPVPAWLRAE
ncbi:P-loop NTPase fold protein [Belnapia rosea]|nr:P-loop NTPase fold protein [Belnapia rosea]